MLQTSAPPQYMAWQLECVQVATRNLRGGEVINKKKASNKCWFLCRHFRFTIMWNKLKNDDVSGRIQSPHFNLTSSISITYVIRLINGLIKLTLWQYNSKVQRSKQQGQSLDTITRQSTTLQITCSSPKMCLSSIVPSLSRSFFIRIIVPSLSESYT